MVRDKKKFDLNVFEENYQAYIAEVGYYGLLRDALLMGYTRGNNFEKITQHYLLLINTLLEYKQLRLKEGTKIFTFEYLEKDVYTLIAYAYALPISNKTWLKLTTEILPEGKDYLTDRVIATRNPEHKFIDFKAWQKQAPYQFKYFVTLGEAINASGDEQIKLIKKHLKKWHQKKWRYDVSIGSDPDFTPNPAYYGQFAFEVALVVMAFDIDDSSFKEDIYYPKELVEYFRESH